MSDAKSFHSLRRKEKYQKIIRHFSVLREIFRIRPPPRRSIPRLPEEAQYNIPPMIHNETSLPGAPSP